MSGSSADNITEAEIDDDRDGNRDDCSHDDDDDDDDVPGILLGNAFTTADDDANDQTALFSAVQQSNESVVHALIDGGVDVNITDDDGQTALFSAVQQSNESVVHALIDGGVDVNIADNNGQTALFSAVQQSNNESMVRALIDGGADVNITDNNGQTALFCAVQQDQNEGVIRALIGSGRALVNVQDIYGRTPFFYALDFPKSAHILVGGCINYPFRLKDHFGCSILDFFVDRRLIHGDADDFLLQNSYFFNLLEQCKVHKITFAEAIFSVVFCLFPLMFREGTVLVFLQAQITRALQVTSQYIGDERCKKTQMLIAIINEQCGEGQGIPEALQLLVELGANPNCVDSEGNTALHYATRLLLRSVPQEIVMEVCLQLEQLGIQFNLRNHENNTPLLFCLSGSISQLQEKSQLSAMKTLVEVCRFLLKCRASIEERTVSGKTVFHLMLERFQQGFRLINDKTIRQDFMLEAIKLLQLFSSQKVAANRVINIPDGELKSPLHKWATLELPSPQDYSGNTGREEFTFKDFLKSTLNELLSCKAKVNDRDGDDQTPLHLCRTWMVVKLLLDVGAKPNDVDSLGASSLLAAAKRKSLRGYQDAGLYPDVTENSKSFWKTAIDGGLDPWTTDNEGESVLSILIRNENFVLAKALVDVACEQRYTQSEAFAVGLLNVICKDQSSRTSWKKILVEDILKSRKCSTSSSEPLRLCCRNVATKFESSSVHCEIIKILLLFGADGKSCLNMPEAPDALKELLKKPIDLDTMPLLIPWTSISKKYQEKLAKVARGQECKEIHEEFWYHKEHIESGSYGDVFVGINKKDGREVAIKRIVKSRTQRPKDKREIRNLIALADCEEIIRYLHFFEDESFSYLALELMEGNLKEYFTDSSSFDAKKAIQLCQDVLKGLVNLHEQNIIHRDLKPGNILYKTNPCLRLKIADFGLSRRVDSSSTTVFSANAGTRCWMAPEVLMGTPDHSKASDMFSCGLVFHYILSVQKHPFSKNNSQKPHQIENNIADGKMEGWDASLAPEAAHLINDMLRSDKKDRPTAGVALGHPLFWSNKKKINLLIAVGNQSEFECPRAIKSTPLSAVETDLEKNFSTILVHGKWSDPRYKDMPTIYVEMTSSKRKFYDTNSVVELVRFIRNAYSHVSEATRSLAVRKMLLEDFVFLEDFPHLLMEVYKAVANHGWNKAKEEIIYEMN